ncbi:MAG: phage tail tape measure protein [Bacteroidales bacterium]|nr:phage tail tape measure protein [Bacteroidales bacterium]
MAKTIKEEDLRLNIIVNGDAGRKQILELDDSVTQLTAKVKKQKEELESLEKQGKKDTQEYRNLAMQLGKNDKALESNKTRLDSLKRQQSVNTMTMEELRKRINETRIALNNAVPGTENWKRLQKELSISKMRMGELRNGAEATKTTLCSFAKTINQYAGLITAGIAGYYKVSGTLNKVTDAYQEYDEALTDAMKTTNFSKEDITALSERLKKIDTKTAQNELLALVRAGGKLGVEGADNLLGFTRAADKINVALSDDLGGNAEAAITAIGKMTDIFNLQEEFGIEKAMLKVGSAINELGMASTANEGYIVDFSKRLAGIAPNADISIDKVLGMAATLDKYGQQAETASTAIGQTIMAMFKRTETFAGIAKMPLQEFADLLNKDVNEALLRVLEGMNDGGGLSSVVAAMDEMHLNGQRASTVLGTLSKNVDELRSQQQLANQAFEEGISLDNEFETKNTSLTAQIEKRKKAILENVVAMGQELMPVAKLAMSAAEKGAVWLLQLLKLGMQLKGVIIALATAYAAYNLSVKTANTIAQLKLFWSKVNRAAMKEEVLALKANTAAVSELNKKDLLLMATKNLLAGNIKVAGTALKMFGKAVSASLGPVGWFVIGVEAVVGVVALFMRKSGEATKALRELNKQTKDTTSGYVEAKTKIDEERRSLESLLDSVRKANFGSKERADAIKKINDRYGDYLPNLLTEKSSNEEIETALKNVNTQLEKKILLQAKENELQDVLKHKTDTVKAALESYLILFKKINGRKMNAAEITSMTDILSKSYDNIQQDGSEEDLYKELKGVGITPDKFFHRESYLNITKEFKKAIQSGKELKAVVDGLYGPADSNGGTSSSSNSNNASVDSGSTSFSSGGGDDKWSLEKDEKHMQQVLALKDKYAKKEIVSEEEYKRQMLELEIKSLEDRIASNQESGEELLKLKNQLADKRISLEEHLAKEAEKTAKEAKEKAEESAALIDEVNKDKVAAENRRYQKEQKKFQGNTKALEAVEKKHQANLRKIMLEGISERESDAKRNRDLAISTTKNRHAAELASFQGSRRDLKDLKQKQAKELAQIDLDYVKEMKDILDDVLNIGSDLTTDGQVTVAFDGISDAELDAVKLKLQEIIALKNQVENSSSASSGDTSDGTNIGRKRRGDTGGELFDLDINQWEAMFDPATDGADRLKLAVQAVGAAVGEAMNLASMWADKQTAIENKQLKDYEKANEEKKNALKERLDAGLITEAHYNAEVERMDAEHDAYEEELRLKQAKRDKQMQLTQAIINTALSITSALAAPFPLSIVAAALAAATGAAQIALIASTPITAGAEEGGFSDVVRAQDGKKYKARLSPDKRGFVNSPTLLVSENGQEYVIPKEGLENPTLLPFINTMETARRNGQLKSLNFASVYPSVQGRVSGGFSSAQTEIQGNSIIYQTDPEMKGLILKLLDRLSRPITAEVSMLGKNGIIEKQEEYNRYKTRGRL